MLRSGLGMVINGRRYCFVRPRAADTCRRNAKRNQFYAYCGREFGDLLGA
jgi:hypothetical protein